MRVERENHDVLDFSNGVDENLVSNTLACKRLALLELQFAEGNCFNSNTIQLIHLDCSSRGSCLEFTTTAIG